MSIVTPNITQSKLVDITNRAVKKMKDASKLPCVLNYFLNQMAPYCHIQKGYVVEFKRGEKSYRLLKFLRTSKWKKGSQKLFNKYIGQGEWRPIAQGRLYKRIFGRPNPYNTYEIEDWMQKKYGVRDELRVPQADAECAIAYPFVGEKSKLYLAMIFFEQKPIPESSKLLLSLPMGHLAYGVYSYENSVLSHTATPRRLADYLNPNLVPKELGWDTIDHSQRVRHVCEMLAEQLNLNKESRFMMSLIASCHDIGKGGLNNPDIRMIIKLLEEEELTDPNDVSDVELYNQHHLSGALFFLQKLEYVAEGKTFNDLSLWAIPILCHHAGDEGIGKELFDDEKIIELRAYLETKVQGTTSDEVLENLHSRKKTKYMKVILQAIDCLRIADKLEDEAGWKFYRPDTRSPEAAVKITIDYAYIKSFNPMVLKVFIENKLRIIDFYESIGKI